jgi:hypothetical protein
MCDPHAGRRFHGRRRIRGPKSVNAVATPGGGGGRWPGGEGRGQNGSGARPVLFHAVVGSGNDGGLKHEDAAARASVAEEER